MSILKSDSKRRGFLLMEVLISIVIISVGLIYIVRSFSTAAKAIDTAALVLKSASLIEARLWDLEAKGALDREKREGDFKEDEGFSWEYRVEGLEDSPLNMLTLYVEWQGPDKRKRRLSVETYVWNKEE